MMASPGARPPARIAPVAILSVLGVVGCGGGPKLAPTKPVVAAVSTSPAVTAPTRVGPAPLRRLTREEYDHTVRDLLGDDTHPADAFPPDDAAGGFASNAAVPVSQILVERYMDAAEALAAAAVKHLEDLAPCAAGEADEACATRFISTFGRRAYRRPLRDDERDALVALYTAKAAETDRAGGVRIVLEAILQSPQFLYRIEPTTFPREGAPSSGAPTPLSGYEVATRLAFFLWVSTPDDALLDDARDGKLDTADGVRVAARRLMKDPRADDGVRSFHRQWLGLRDLEVVSKDALAPRFTRSMKAAMVEETLRFATNAVERGGDTIATLFTSNQSFVDAPLAELYGIPAPSPPFALVTLPADQRAGLLTQASVMARLANGDETAPVTRGKFVRERLLCDVVSPPPPDARITPPKVDPTKPTKERFRQHRTDPTCNGCHERLDPIGFGFEHYDGVGAWRTGDGNFAVDATGTITGLDGADVSFDGAVELGARLAKSPQVRRCVATQWFRFAFGRSETSDDDGAIDMIHGAFAASGFDVRELLVAIATSDALRYARSEEATTP